MNIYGIDNEFKIIPNNIILRLVHSIQITKSCRNCTFLNLGLFGDDGSCRTKDRWQDEGGLQGSCRGLSLSGGLQGPLSPSGHTKVLTDSEWGGESVLPGTTFEHCQLGWVNSDDTWCIMVCWWLNKKK